jgi:hypothetical protein
MRIIGVLVATLCFQLPLSAAEKDGAADRMICKYRQETGTRFKTRVCMTAGQWEEMAEQNRAGLKELVDRPQIETNK